jgi:two-component system KDP operon response regulator KdpE
VPEPTILVVEDEVAIRRFLRAALSNQGYRLFESDTGADALEAAATRQPDVVILDLGLPDMDGLEVIQRFREWSAVPIIVLSARGQERDKVIALDAGADDYVSKPFGPEELLARIRAALRRRAFLDRGDAIFIVGQLKVDLARRLVSMADRDIHVTPLEYGLLATLVRHAGKVLTHRQLLREVWGPHADDAHVLRVHMAQLRRKLEAEPANPRYILTESGVGYRLVAE